MRLGSKSAWSGGIQAGPRLPTLPQTHGLGMEALVIVGRTTESVHLFAQAGTLIDPSEPYVGYRRPVHPYGFEGGLDLDLDFDDHDKWSFMGEVGGIKYFSPHADQLHLAAGPSCQVSPGLEVSFVALVGVLRGGDRFGGLFGATSRFKMSDQSSSSANAITSRMASVPVASAIRRVEADGVAAAGGHAARERLEEALVDRVDGLVRGARAPPDRATKRARCSAASVSSPKPLQSSTPAT